MPINAESLHTGGERIVQALDDALAKVDGAEGELALDFSSVARVDAAAIRALEKLAGAAEGKGVQIVLRGVNVDVYKVLKLLKLTPRLSFAV